jgi:hypothetical protein
MQVAFGNSAPIAGRNQETDEPLPSVITDGSPTVTVFHISPWDVTYDEEGNPVDTLRTVRATFDNIVSTWKQHSLKPPTWTTGTPDCPPGLVDMLANYFEIPANPPEDVELTHHTTYGPPGVGPDGPLTEPASEAQELAEGTAPLEDTNG